MEIFRSRPDQIWNGSSLSSVNESMYKPCPYAAFFIPILTRHTATVRITYAVVSLPCDAI
jgi:hypothetical protein